MVASARIVSPSWFTQQQMQRTPHFGATTGGPLSMIPVSTSPPLSSPCIIQQHRYPPHGLGMNMSLKLQRNMNHNLNENLNQPSWHFYNPNGLEVSNTRNLMVQPFAMPSPCPLASANTTPMRPRQQQQQQMACPVMLSRKAPIPKASPCAVVPMRAEPQQQLPVHRQPQRGPRQQPSIVQPVAFPPAVSTLPSSQPPKKRLMRRLSSSSTSPTTTSAVVLKRCPSSSSSTSSTVTNPMDLLADVATAVVEKIEGSSRSSSPSVLIFPASPNSTSDSADTAAAAGTMTSATGTPSTTTIPRRISLLPSSPSSSCSSAIGVATNPSSPAHLCTTAVTSNMGSLIEQPERMDIIFSTGLDVQTQPGNKLYRRLVRLNRERFQTAGCAERSAVVRNILQCLLDQGSRFLSRRGDEFLPMSTKSAYKRIRSALERNACTSTNIRALSTPHQAFKFTAATASSDVATCSSESTSTTTSNRSLSSGAAFAAGGNEVGLLMGVGPSSEPRVRDQSGRHPTRPHPNDVIFGRGNNIANHAGNLLFRQFVLQEKDRYNMAQRQEKGAIAASIIERIQKLNPPGRFLEQCPENGFYQDVQYHRVLEKTCQACRERKWGSNGK